MGRKIYLGVAILLVGGFVFAGIRGYRIWNLVSKPTFKPTEGIHHK